MSINKHNTPFNVLRHKNIHEVAPKDPVSVIATAITLGATGGAVYGLHQFVTGRPCPPLIMLDFVIILTMFSQKSGLLLFFIVALLPF